MDEQKKAKIRKTARILHWVTLVLLAIVLFTGLVSRFFEPYLSKIYFDRPLRTSSSALISAFSNFHFDRPDQLSAFLPPANPDAMILWGKKMEAHLGQPAAVFISEGSAITWVNVPDGFQAAVDQVPRLLRKDVSKEDRGSMDSLGAFERRRTGVEVDSVGYTVWIVGPLADSLRWGAVLRFDDNWRPFFAKLRAGSTAPMVNPVAERVDDFLQVENNLQKPTSRTGMRAFQHDELIYQTPDVDTTHQSTTYDLSSGVRLEYYLSDEDEAARNVLSSHGLHWQNILILIAFGCVVNLFWRWIRKLTEPAPQ